MSKDVNAVNEERAEVAFMVDTVLEKRLGYRCAFVVVWVRADAAPVLAGYSTNVSATDAVHLLQETIDSLENIR